MNWTPEPATERQLTYLRRLGYTSPHTPTRDEATQLIRDLQEQQVTRLHQHAQNLVEHDPQQLRHKVESARASHADMAQVMAERQQFWADTCREVGQMHSTSKRVLDLYKKHGCRFQVPSLAQVQNILDALDGAAPGWDQDYPDLFFQTLELNYPQLLRHF